jgi:hypothetical protein
MPADEGLADAIKRPLPFLVTAAEQGIDDLKEEIFEEVRVFLKHARRHQQLPRPAARVLDAVQEVRLAGAFVPQDRHDLTVRERIRAIQVNDRVQQIPLSGEEFSDVIPRTIFIVRIAGKIVAKRIASRPERRTEIERRTAVCLCECCCHLRFPRLR